MVAVAMWLAGKARALNDLRYRFAQRPGDAAPERGQLSRDGAMILVEQIDRDADNSLPYGPSMSSRVRIGVSVAALIIRAGILADLISLRRDVVRNLLDSSLAGDRSAMYTHLNQLWDCLGLPAIEGPRARNVLSFRQKETRA